MKSTPTLDALIMAIGALHQLGAGDQHIQVLQAIIKQKGCDVYDPDFPRLTDFIDTILLG